jgi:prevent-host-death family protein
MTPTLPATWTVAEAKNKFSEVIEKARSEGPQTITRHGRNAVVVVDAKAWERSLQRKTSGSFGDFLRASPLRDSGLEITRLRGGIREIDL